MHITCQNCETVFNLDERMLKPGGSKVRCSQCGNIFVAQPPAPEPIPEPEPEPLLEPEPPQPQAPALDEALEGADEPREDVGQELEGIDLAELDAILDSEPKIEGDGSQIRENADIMSDTLDEEDLIPEGDETDLDLDFDMNLEADSDGVAAEAAEAAGSADAGDLLDDLDLDMDFELDDGFDLDEGGAEPQAPSASEQGEPEAAPKAPAETESKVLDEEDLDLALDDFDLDSVEIEAEEDAAEDLTAPVSAEAEHAEPDLSLDDLDLDVEAPVQEEEAPSDMEELSLDEQAATAQDVAAEAVEEIESLDLENLDLDSVAEPEEEREDEELSLSPGAVDQSFEPEIPAAAETADAALDDLDLDDLDLDEILNDAVAEPPEKDTVVEEELSLEEGLPGKEEAPAEQASIDEDELDLRLDDLDLGDEGDTLAEDISVEEQEPELAREPELGLEDKPAEELSDELDLSDLGNILEDSEERIPEQESEPDDLELSLDDEPPVKEEASREDTGLEELEFELDAEFEDKPIAKTAEPEPVAEVEEEDEELDLSDIEQMLEGDTILESASAKSETSSTGEPESLGSGLGDELDLSEIEEAIDSSGGETDEAVGDEEDLELDLDLPSGEKPSEAEADLEELDLDLDLGEDTKEPEEDMGPLDLELDLEEEGEDLKLELEDRQAEPEEELDLSELGGLVVDEKAAVKSETIDTGDIELEFEIEEQAQVEDYEPERSQTFEAGADIPVDETLSPKPAPPKGPPKPRPRKKKKGTNKLLVVLLILILIGAGGYYGYDPYIKDLMEKYDIQIPYLNQYLNPKPKDPAGTNNLSVLDINSKFIENDKAGRLFIISGKVRNGYGNNRGNIMLNGKLFSKGKVLVKSEQVYAGIIIPDQDLKSEPIAEIKQRLKKIPGPQEANTIAKPGQTVPFMVVFSDLPENLDEFVVEKVRSQQVR